MKGKLFVSKNPGRWVGFWGILFLWSLISCTSIKKNDLPEYYRVRKCYATECDRLKRYGLPLSKTNKPRPGELCFKDECELLDEYGPNGLPILEKLKQEVKKKPGHVNIIKKY